MHTPQTALLRLWDSQNNVLRTCLVELGEHETRRQWEGEILAPEAGLERTGMAGAIDK